MKATRVTRITSTRSYAELLDMPTIVVREDEQSSVKPGDRAILRSADGYLFRATVTDVHLDGLLCLMSAHIHLDIHTDPTKATD